MKSPVAHSPRRAATALALLAALTLTFASAAEAAVKIELSGAKRGSKCTSSQPLVGYSSWTCTTKDLRVVAPGGTIRYAYAVSAVRGCSEVGAIVRTTGKKSPQYSFTQQSAAAGKTKRGTLTANLSTIDPLPFTPKKGTVLKLSIEMPWQSCSDLTSFKVTVRFPTLSKAS